VAGNASDAHTEFDSSNAQVPLDLRSMWRQRLRWFKGGHLFVLSTDSIFFHSQKHVSLFQKLAYCLGPIAHFTNFWAEPIMCDPATAWK
jgi:cellulose synthase/poly-beta-1,6-N-acetylglucosamine synthase-like glycosyltransferase